MKRTMTLLAVLALLIAACGGDATTTTTAASGGDTTTTAAAGGEMDALIAAAQAEGLITTIALPRDWCNYGGVIDTFTEKYGLEYNGLAPDAGSADELEAVRANQGSSGPQAPDVVDIGLAFGPVAKDEGLLQPYMVSTWDSIPDDAKDAEAHWYGDYYGVLAFEVNADVVESVPQDWSDLLSPDYNGQIALAGDPRVSAQAISAVFAAGLANGGSLDDPEAAAQAGLEFWAEVAAAGNLVPVIAESGTVASGETPISIRWTYNGLANRDANAEIAAIEVVVPASGRYAGVYVQGISAYAPQPNAAKLWMEFLYSDEGQNLWLDGYCHPIRYEDLVANNAVPQDKLDRLPDVEGAVFPSLEQIGAASEVITTQWDAVVGVNVGG
ncbi:MAG TPA: extracellular solute-binding protein [Acidimicrobiia bacterium]|nr:extracellular solute-binding protein [Acidimicrobiia bacterium]